MRAILLTILIAFPALAAEEPFLGAYMRFSQIFDGAETVAAREAAMDAALDRFKAEGLNTAMPYITTTSGAAMYPSEVIQDHRFGDDDPLKYFMRAAHARGLKVYPVVCVLACGHDHPAGVLKEHPEWALRTPEGAPIGSISPANPEARDWVTRLIGEIVDRYQPDGVLLDYLRYYNRPTRLDPVGERALQAHLFDHPNVDPVRAEQQFREQELTKLAAAISREARARKTDLRLAIYSWGPHVAKDHRVAQAWPVWSRAGYIDMVNISGYCYPDNYGDDYLEVFSKRIGDAVLLNRAFNGQAAVTFCLGIHTSHGTIQSATWINDYLTRAAAEGVEGMVIFTWTLALPFLDAPESKVYLPRFRGAVQGP